MPEGASEGQTQHIEKYLNDILLILKKSLRKSKLPPFQQQQILEDYVLLRAAAEKKFDTSTENQEGSNPSTNSASPEHEAVNNILIQVNTLIESLKSISDRGDKGVLIQTGRSGLEIEEKHQLDEVFNILHLSLQESRVLIETDTKKLKDQLLKSLKKMDFNRIEEKTRTQKYLAFLRPFWGDVKFLLLIEGLAVIVDIFAIVAVIKFGLPVIMAFVIMQVFGFLTQAFIAVIYPKFKPTETYSNQKSIIKEQIMNYKKIVIAGKSVEKSETIAGESVDRKLINLLSEGKNLEKLKTAYAALYAAADACKSNPTKHQDALLVCAVAENMLDNEVIQSLLEGKTDPSNPGKQDPKIINNAVDYITTVLAESTRVIKGEKTTWEGFVNSMPYLIVAGLVGGMIYSFIKAPVISTAVLKAGVLMGFLDGMLKRMAILICAKYPVAEAIASRLGFSSEVEKKIKSNTNLDCVLSQFKLKEKLHAIEAESIQNKPKQANGDDSADNGESSGDGDGATAPTTP